MGKSALVTGGTKGIGLAVVKSFLARGVNVAFTSRSEEAATFVEQELQGAGAKVMGVACDARDFAAQQRLVDSMVAAWGSCDYVIANAGVGHFAPVDELTIEQWDEVIDINLSGVFYTTKAAIPALKESKGYLITIASLAGTNFFEKGAAYNASKFGLVGFTQAVMLDLRKYDVKVSTIMPGSVSTHFNGHHPSDADAWKIQPEDVAQIVENLIDMHPRTLPSKVEVRPSVPPSAKR
jgi:NAD(P)-dependent dehydrogenase (short-subunit alcohol dehydrogenase family)